MKLIREEELTPSGNNTALLQDTTHFLTAGSKNRSPRQLWARVLEAGSRQVRARAYQQRNDTRTDHQDQSSLVMRMLNCGYRADRIDPAHQRIMVCSLIIPFEDAVGVSQDGVSRPESTLLCLVVKAASALEDFTIFDSLLVKGMLQFKWDSYGASIFHAAFSLDVAHLLCFSVFAFTAVQRDRSTWAVIIYLFASLSSIGSSSFLILEMRQLLLDGARTYFRGAGNYVDISALFSQLYVIFLYLAKSDYFQALAAWSVLLSFCKVLNFMRGFPSFGPLVRMITKIIKDVQNFFIVLGVMLVGFAMAFSVALPEETIFTWQVLLKQCDLDKAFNDS